MLNCRLDILANSRNSYVSLIRQDFAVLFALRGAALGLPDPSVDCTAALDFAAQDQRRLNKLVIRSKLAFTSHFVLTVLGKHWSNDMMNLADCYRVPRLDAVPDSLGGGDVVDGAQSYRCWCSFVSTSFAGLVGHSTHNNGPLSNGVQLPHGPWRLFRAPANVPN